MYVPKSEKAKLAKAIDEKKILLAEKIKLYSKELSSMQLKQAIKRVNDFESFGDVDVLIENTTVAFVKLSKMNEAIATINNMANEIRDLAERGYE